MYDKSHCGHISLALTWEPDAVEAPARACTCNAPAGQPTVTVTYSPSIDFVCSIIRGGTIKDERQAELVSRKAEFEELWTSIGPRLIGATEAITGQRFPPDHFTAHLTLCNLPSQSSIIGISVNMRYALRSLASSPVPMRYKVDTLYHELLHVFLARHPIEKSALLAEHALEPECTRNHLHLLALQKAVLRKLQEPDALRDVIAVDGQLPGGCYQRAWELVNATDTEYLQYIAELAKSA